MGLERSQAPTGVAAIILIRSSSFLTVGLIVTAPHRGRRRPFLSRGDVPIDEALRVLGEIVVGIESAFQHLVRDVLRHVPRPALGGIEGDDAEGVAVLPGDEIADNRLAVRFGDVCLE
jgi:hypothetical protein